MWTVDLGTCFRVNNINSTIVNYIVSMIKSDMSIRFTPEDSFARNIVKNIKWCLEYSRKYFRNYLFVNKHRDNY